MDKIKNILNKVSSKVSNRAYSCLAGFTFLLSEELGKEAGEVDLGDPTELAGAIEKLKPEIVEIVKPIAAIFMFIGIIFVGLNIIIKRNKPDERSNAMYGLLTIGLGAFILGSAGIIYAFIMDILG